MSFLDLVVSSKNLRLLASAISALAKVGSELLICSDKDGFYVSILSDTKSSYVTIRFRKGFFVRCNPAMNGEGGEEGRRDRERRRRRRKARKRREREQRRKRREMESQSNHSSGKKKAKKKGKKKRKHGADDILSSSDSDTANSSDFEPSDDEEEDEEVFLCRVPVKNIHNIVRRPRDVNNLRITAEGLEDDFDEDDDDDDMDDDNEGRKSSGGRRGKTMQLVFEFTSPNGVKVVHKAMVAPSERTTVVAPIENSSYMRCRVIELNGLVEHIKKSQEVAMTFTEDTVKVESYNQDSTMPMGIAEAGKAHGGGMKTEATMEKEEMDSYEFRDNRDPKDEANADAPDNVNEEVRLVFSLKEVKALIEFGKGISPSSFTPYSYNQNSYSQRNNSTSWSANPEEDYLTRGENPITVFYEWGGKPVTFKVEGVPTEGEEEGEPDWDAELISATLAEEDGTGTVKGV